MINVNPLVLGFGFNKDPCVCWGETGNFLLAFPVFALKGSF
jgi:hypothetical protein